MSLHQTQSLLLQCMANNYGLLATVTIGLLANYNITLYLNENQSENMFYDL